MQPWITHQKTTIYDQPPWLKIELHQVELPNGQVIPNWPWIKTPDYINVVAEMENGDFLCFRQLKYGLPHPTLALVGGYIEPGENPLATARRELREETGCEAPVWIDLGHFLVDPNRGMATGYLFLARQVHQVGTLIPDDLEEQEIIYLTRDELRQALEGGEIEVLAWAAAVALALSRL